MASLKYIAGADLMTVTLTSAYTAADGHMHLTSGHGARLPTAGDFWIRTKTGTLLVFKVTARSTDDITVTCVTAYGADANIDAGMEFAWSLTAEALDQLRGDLVQTGADASKATEKAGNLYLPNNGFVLYRDTGAAMAPWGPIFPLVAPINADYSDLNSPTVVTTNGGITISGAASGDNIRGRIKAVPGSTPYTKTVGLFPRFISENYHSAGIVISDGTKCIKYGITSGSSLVCDDWTNVTTFSGANFSLLVLGASFYFLRYYDGGTNREFSWSTDGVNFETLFTEGRTTFLTATHIGMYIHVNNGTRGTLATFLHWVDA